MVVETEAFGRNTFKRPKYGKLSWMGVDQFDQDDRQNDIPERSKELQSETESKDEVGGRGGYDITDDLSYLSVKLKFDKGI
ncbi:hypothetical protein VTL71DRAFT_5995 [Oculimacula yallundae]|uniref:Uncharacterized protein n=1 Tax=Oculimacula yallundae TaxID=86028 RepID=A0ABR4BZ50_9HELO